MVYRAGEAGRALRDGQEGGCQDRQQGASHRDRPNEGNIPTPPPTLLLAWFTSLLTLFYTRRLPCQAG